VLVKGPPADVEAAVRDASAGWLLDGMPSLAAMRAGDSGIGSLQWSLGGNGVRIGDANLARDALSSQGIAVACSEALYAAAIRTPVDAALVHARQIEQRATHLDTLGRVIERCRFREASIWSDYASFVARFGDRPVPAETAALRQNQVQRMLRMCFESEPGKEAEKMRRSYVPSCHQRLRKHESGNTTRAWTV